MSSKATVKAQTQQVGSQIASLLREMLTEQLKWQLSGRLKGAVANEVNKRFAEFDQRLSALEPHPRSPPTILKRFKYLPAHASDPIHGLDTFCPPCRAMEVRRRRKTCSRCGKRF